MPQSLKDADVSPVFKKLDRLIKENYRPVSVLTATSKVYESIMCDQLLSHFRNILSKLLSGFRKGYSCEQVLISCIESWKKAIDRDECVACILMDLSRAFDSLPHGLLIAKLHAYGCDVNACKLIRDYLSSRRQRVKVQNTFGEWKYVERGVPQGSLAGPLLFNIFINDFIYIMEDKCDVYNWADDNTLSYHHKDPGIVKTRLEEAAKVAIRWFKENNMKANPDKFQAMVLSRKKVSITFDIGDVTIVPTKCVKLLGIYIDENLSFDEHVNHLCKKAGKQVNALSRLSNILSQDTKKVVFNTFISSTFNYCQLVYHVCGKTSSVKMEHVVERGLKMVYSDCISDGATLRKTVNVSSLFMSRIRLLCLYVYKSLNDMLPVSIDFEIKDTPYSFRSKKMLIQPAFCTKTYGYNSLSYLGAKLWNMLPNECKDLEFCEFKQYVLNWDGLTCCGQCHLCFI